MEEDGWDRDRELGWEIATQEGREGVARGEEEDGQEGREAVWREIKKKTGVKEGFITRTIWSFCDKVNFKFSASI